MTFYNRQAPITLLNAHFTRIIKIKLCLISNKESSETLIDSFHAKIH